MWRGFRRLSDVENGGERATLTLGAPAIPVIKLLRDFVHSRSVDDPIAAAMPRHRPKVVLSAIPGWTGGNLLFPSARREGIVNAFLAVKIEGLSQC